MRALTSTKEKSSLSLTHKKKVLSRKEPLLLRRLLPRALSLSLPPIERRSCKSFSSFKLEREKVVLRERKKRRNERSFDFFWSKNREKKSKKRKKKARDLSFSLSPIHSFILQCLCLLLVDSIFVTSSCCCCCCYCYYYYFFFSSAV